VCACVCDIGIRISATSSFIYVEYNNNTSTAAGVYIITTSSPGPEGTDSRATRYEKQLKTSRLISNRRSVTMSRPAYTNEK